MWGAPGLWPSIAVGGWPVGPARPPALIGSLVACTIGGGPGWSHVVSIAISTIVLVKRAKRYIMPLPSMYAWTPEVAVGPTSWPAAARCPDRPPRPVGQRCTREAAPPHAKAGAGGTAGRAFAI